MTNTPNQKLLSEIDQFLALTGMGVSYFGKMSSGNSELVQRLRAGGRVWPETAERVRDFMANHKAKHREHAA